VRFSRRIYYWLCSVALALVAPCIGTCLQAQEDSCATAVSQPGDLSLQLSLKNGQIVFHKGEIIAL